MKKVLGIVTARGGSKSIPRKNVKDLAGKPLIAWTIESAKKSGVLDRVVLTTDDQEIAAVGRAWGAEVPFMRPRELAEDKTPHLPVMQHAVKWLEENEKYVPDYVMILQPTSPLRQPWHIQESVEIITKTNADSVVSIMPIPHHFHPLWAFEESKHGFLRLMATKKPIYTRIHQRQLLPKAYIHNSVIYLFRRRLLFDEKNPNFYGDKVAPYVVDEKYSVNIDSLEEWAIAEKSILEFFS